jgi:hypothetical protein
MKKYLYFSALLTIAACSSNDSNETGIEAIITTEHYF